MRRQQVLVGVVAALALVAFTAAGVQAQPQRGQRGQAGFGAGFGGSNVLMLLRMESVRKELEVVEDQNAAIQKLGEELRGQRGQRGQRGAEMTDAEREKIRQEMAAREKAVWDKLGGILLPNQVKRLKEISLQSQLRMGMVNALLDPAVAEGLNLTQAQKDQLNKIQTDSRAAMREAFQGGGRPDMEKMAAMRKENDSKAEAVLTAEQKAKLEQMKGKPFEFPAFGARGGRRGGGGNP